MHLLSPVAAFLLVLVGIAFVSRRIHRTFVRQTHGSGPSPVVRVLEAARAYIADEEPAEGGR
jgi:hypothetical protein